MLDPPPVCRESISSQPLGGGIDWINAPKIKRNSPSFSFTLSLSPTHTHTHTRTHTRTQTHKGGTDMDMINYVSSISSSMNEWPNDYRLPTVYCLLTLETEFSCSSLSRKGTTRKRSKETINHHSFQGGKKKGPK